ncbi:prephenate dehydrogenase [Propioniciclava sp.]|uniref:prephenate dehydrogenase n=1 Tax=Propioniciclava sp. TaxID=2038686 RepID=UPI002609B0A4|nr:prephenate dehydrogenase [Propioniciclava sp.]
MIEVTLSPALVIGTGLVGASVAMALTNAGVDVHLTDARHSHAVVAASRGAGSIEPLPPADYRLVVVAVPPAALASVIAESLERYPHATVTDVGSVKGVVLAALRATGADLARYCGSHPMAGSQKAGPLTARADLFVDRTWVITPHDTASAQAVLTVERVAELCGARLVTMAAQHHDEAVGQVSHVPQLVSALVGGGLLDLPPEHLRLAGQGLRDVTRIAGSDPRLWQQIIAANARAVRVELEELHSSLGELIAVLDDPDEVRAFLERGRQGVRSLPGKHGSSPATWVAVVVEIPDAPGALAKLFADIEAAGVNVEDVTIDHDLERQVGWLAVQVEPASATRLARALTDAGWFVRP